VELDLDETQRRVGQVLSRPILAAGVKLRHDPYALADAIMETVADPRPGPAKKIGGQVG
jgi:hypothetical protein